MHGQGTHLSKIPGCKIYQAMLSGSSNRRKRSTGGGYSVSVAVASCRAWDPDINDWIELGTVVCTF